MWSTHSSICISCLKRNGSLTLRWSVRVKYISFVRVKYISKYMGFFLLSSKRKKNISVPLAALWLYMGLLSLLFPPFITSVSPISLPFTWNKLSGARKSRRRPESMLPSFTNNHSRRAKVTLPQRRRKLLKIFVFSFVFIYRLVTVNAVHCHQNVQLNKTHKDLFEPTQHS